MEIEKLSKVMPPPVEVKRGRL